MYVRKRGNKTSFSVDVVGIKVTRPIRKEDDYGIETYYRTIRFELYGGKVLDVYCSGSMEEYIKLRSVKSLKPRKKPRGGARTRWNNPGNHDDPDWLPPKLYTGTGDDPLELPPPPSLRHVIASGVRDLLLDYAGQVKRMFWSSIFPPHERADSEETVSCECCGASYPASAPGETGFVSTPYGTVRLCGLCQKMVLSRASLHRDKRQGARMVQVAQESLFLTCHAPPRFFPIRARQGLSVGRQTQSLTR